MTLEPPPRSIHYKEPAELSRSTEPVPMDTDTEGDEKHDWLRELAIIATGPQSPLLNQSSDRNKDKYVTLPTYLK